MSYHNEFLLLRKISHGKKGTATFSSSVLAINICIAAKPYPVSVLGLQNFLQKLI